MTDFQPYVKDIRWLFVRCKQVGIEPPQGLDCEAFAERVSILLADGGMTEGEARELAFAGYLDHKQRFADIERQTFSQATA